MKALSVKQPWASLIAVGLKSVELRSWRTHYRGPLVVVASAGVDRAALARLGGRNGPRGVTVAIVDLVDVRPAVIADVDDALSVPRRGAFAWCLTRPRLLVATAVRGRLGLYELDDTLVVAAGRAA